MANRRKPTEQKRTQGTLRASRTNAAEPKYEAAIPDPPEWLGPVALAEWHRAAGELHAQRVLARTDMAALALYCEMFAEVAALTEVLNNGERFYKVDEGGLWKEHPASKARREAAQSLRQLAGELGMTPAARSKVSSIPESKETDPLQRLLQKKAAEQRKGQERAN